MCRYGFFFQREPRYRKQHLAVYACCGPLHSTGLGLEQILWSFHARPSHHRCLKEIQPRYILACLLRCCFSLKYEGIMEIAFSSIRTAADTCIDEYTLTIHFPTDLSALWRPRGLASDPSVEPLSATMHTKNKPLNFTLNVFNAKDKLQHALASLAVSSK
jgi:hypothetical protein